MCKGYEEDWNHFLLHYRSCLTAMRPNVSPFDAM